jgi:hypothetical protein
MTIGKIPKNPSYTSSDYWSLELGKPNLLSKRKVKHYGFRTKSHCKVPMIKSHEVVDMLMFSFE